MIFRGVLNDSTPTWPLRSWSQKKRGIPIERKSFRHEKCWGRYPNLLNCGMLLYPNLVLQVLVSQTASPTSPKRWLCFRAWAAWRSNKSMLAYCPCSTQERGHNQLISQDPARTLESNVVLKARSQEAPPYHESPTHLLAPHLFELWWMPAQPPHKSDVQNFCGVPEVPSMKAATQGISESI